MLLIKLSIISNSAYYTLIAYRLVNTVPILAQGFSKVAECVPHPKGKKERDAAGGRPPRHALSFPFLPPQAASLS